MRAKRCHGVFHSSGHLGLPRASPGDGAPMSDDDELLTDDELAALADVDALLADPALWESPSEGVEDGVVALISEARRTELAEPPPGNVDVVAPVVQLDDSRRARRRRVWSLAAAALVGAAAAALVTGVIVSNNNGSATTSAGATPQQQVQLVGTDLAPQGAGGSAGLISHPSGVELRLAVPGLPARTGGDFYQVWVKSCDGSLLVPAGSFHDLDDATGWVGVSMTDFPVITVTTESAVGGKDPGQESSGQIVASGTVEGACG